MVCTLKINSDEREEADPYAQYAWNRLVKLTDGANTVAEYQYDARGRRIVKKSYTSGTLSETRHFYYSNGWQVLEERSGTGFQPMIQYVWGLNYVDEMVCRDRDANGGTSGDGTLEQTHYVVQDANFNVTALVETDGTVAERYRYTPYGYRTVLDSSHTPQAASLYGFVHGHQGLRHDADSNLVENRNRVLHVTLGRFVQRDPAEYVDGITLYEYVGSNPINAFDPTGLLIWTNDPTMWLTQTFLEDWPRGSGKTWPFPAGALAATVGRLVTNVKCFCDGTSYVGKYILGGPSGMKIWYNAEVTLRPTYASPAQAAWVRRAEGDHVSDFDKWAVGRGQKVAERVENAWRTKSFWTQARCEKDIKKDLDLKLEASLRDAERRSIRTHDDTDRHTWSNHNKRRP